jgi:hypothetical protein
MDFSNNKNTYIDEMTNLAAFLDHLFHRCIAYANSLTWQDVCVYPPNPIARHADV